MEDEEIITTKKEEEASWEVLGLSPTLLAQVFKAGFERPTPIQVKAIPVGLSTSDLIASAKTGSGKTASFCLPIIEKLLGRRGTYALILCPTREIALQTQQTMELFGTPMGIKSAVLIGGVDIKQDILQLNGNPHVIVGTPGRICDHLDRGNLWLEFIEILVLDEADRMLDMGFSKELSRIVKETPKTRQTLLYSATISSVVEVLAKNILNKPQKVSIGKSGAIPKSVHQEILWVNEANKRRELIRLIEREPGTFLVFTSTKDGATRLWRSLHSAGIHDSTYISSNKAQVYREEALEGFKTGKYRVMVATDVAGRGIHVDAVAYVVNFDVPMEPEDYVHRIGRTGRQDAEGIAITFATPSDKGSIERIEKAIGQSIYDNYAKSFQPEPERAERSSRGPSRGGPRRSGGSSSGGRSRSSSSSSSSRRR